VRLVGQSYFVHRFEIGNGSARTPSEGWRESLPLIQPPQARLSDGRAILRIGDLQVPISQSAEVVSGSNPWIAHSEGRTLQVGGILGGSLVLGFDPWFAMGAGLLGFAVPDDGSFGLTNQQHTPWLDLFADEFAAALGRVGIEIRRRSFWPANAPFALCLTHDVDRQRKTFQYATHIGRKKGLRGATKQRVRANRPYWGFDVIRDIERAAGLRSTFFMLQEGAQAKRGPRNRILAWGLADFEHPELASTVVALAQDRWEIGLHASLASTAALDRLVLEKQKLEAIVGKNVDGVRQHHLRVKVPNRWDEFTRAGLVYDSSFGFRHTWGFRAGTAFPYSLAGSKDFLPLHEVPLHIMESTLASSDDAWGECVRALDAVESVGGVLTVLFHQRFFDAGNFPGYAELYERLVAEARRRGAWIGPGREVVRAWLG